MPDYLVHQETRCQWRLSAGQARIDTPKMISFGDDEVAVGSHFLSSSYDTTSLDSSVK
jgi:hypothetical protein